MDEEITQFIGITGATPEQARFFLESCGGDLTSAMDSFFETGGQMDAVATSEDAEPMAVGQAPPSQAAAGATGGSAPPASRPSNRTHPRGASGNIRGFNDFSNDDNESDDDNEYFTGGAKSGMMVQDPNTAGGKRNHDEQVEALFEKARQYVAQPGDEMMDDPRGRRPGAFSGVGRRLDSTDSGEAAPAATPAEPPQRLVHTVCFYNNGFTVDDGPLRTQDDPANQPFLQSIENGECPRELEPPKGTRTQVPVRVELMRKNEDWVPPPTPKYVAFSGSGRTLGSSGAGSSAAATAPPAAPPPPTGEFAVDDAQPVTTLQLRLHDGTRMTARFNHTHTVGDVHQFIRSSRADSPATFQLMTSFPPTPLTEFSMTLKDAGLIGAVVIQKL
uniref:UBX domain-containing protein n=1 Tax=Pyramimonas obovata TaxID=1411642 RepID=A0A7S0RKA3_9CHLO|mmetsp:Transcript_35624/g.77772  ORF Transcript_35624/g.77772 Transcript_35624/m.77772 type:complete len:388 (+) Transcript_35624:56-1219(+)|eukprot:CAMPEP_0118926368 /NCGR_PEP_ID=MMETSP1169-20130426/4064_1 /TAXON_ID=36882 /ORGANISM="Pyramimonas obovata, Strain CCMP722" /LENGTH=387 /DNA_ID=CAMNT_0006867905 /DNA_START=14 /DNA_END=1177 /DNA_ORIENTATION=+